MPLAVAVKVAVAPAQTVTLPGCMVICGGVLTVNTAAAVVTLPQVFVNTARYRLPLSVWAVTNVRLVLVAPGMLLKVMPPSVLTCHCTVDAGELEAAAVKVTALPAVMVWLTGFMVTLGGVLTVKTAALVVAVPAALVKTARNWKPLLAATAPEKFSVVFVAPGMSVKVAPPLELNCHCTVGVGVPLAAAVNVAVPPAQTV